MRSSVFSALADPVRRDLLEHLREHGPASLGELAAERPITRQAVTKHLDVLHRAGLIGITRHGRHRIHTVEPAPLKQLADFLAPYAAAWDERLARLTTHLDAHLDTTPDTPPEEQP